MPQVECPICEYPYAELRYQLSDRFFATAPDRFNLYQCRSCGLFFQRLQELPGELDRFYPPGYWWNGSGRLSPLEKSYREWMIRHDQLKYVLACLSGPQCRLLDIGCGAGTFVKLAAGQGLDAFGLEQSREAAELAARELPDKIFHASEQDLIERAEKFDLITLFHCLEHLPQPLDYLKKIKELLNERGKLILQVPNVASFQARLMGPRWYGLDCPRHIFNYSAFSLMLLLGRAGYRIHNVRHFSLRDNAAALLSSLFAPLDPMSQKVRLLRKKGKSNSPGLALKEAVYLSLLPLAQIFALVEAGFGRGGTVTIHASKE
ncbi:MAG: class I SAM-dependent methyltransferase [Acidobacteriota bacterium]